MVSGHIYLKVNDKMQMVEVLDLSRRKKTPSPDSCGGLPPNYNRIVPIIAKPEAIRVTDHHRNFLLGSQFVPQNLTEDQFKPSIYPPFLHKITQEISMLPNIPNMINNNNIEPVRYSNIPIQEAPAQIPQIKTRHISGNHSESDDGISDTSSIVTSVTNNSKSPSPSTSGLYPKVINREGKVTRPFKAYPRDPLAIAASLRPTDPESEERYNSFRKRLLDEIHAANGGQPTVSNPKMRRTNNKVTNESEDASRSSGNEDDWSNKNQSKTEKNSEPCNQSLNISTTSNSSTSDKGNLVKDSAYYERRKKNNAAAKKSRDRRRIKEDEIAIRAAFLERENMELRYELAIIRKQLAMCGVAPPTSLCT